MPDSTAAKRALASLARTETESETAPEAEGLDYRSVIQRATAATDSLEAAAAFREDVGLGTLETAVERAEADLSACAEEGREALEAFRAFEAAATAGDDHFRSGRDTDLGPRDESTAE